MAFSYRDARVTIFHTYPEPRPRSVIDGAKKVLAGAAE